MTDAGFTVDGPYLRDAARELSEALASARAIVGWSNATKELMADAGSLQLSNQILNIVETSRDTMAALVAKGEAVAVGLLVAADQYDLAEARAWEALQYPPPLLPPSQRIDTTPPPIDMTQPLGPPEPAAPAGPVTPAAPADPGGPAASTGPGAAG
ncbi:hypothetical protein [Yinghuangia sp. YIM S10712]|uniref:hypothetical protein n=1 Tax=Yinghuangia sp. YIM S10712 TaxID=3436930 RepID=UPI003F5341F9